jgi:hypothetical protein
MGTSPEDFGVFSRVWGGTSKPGRSATRRSSITNNTIRIPIAETIHMSIISVPFSS